MPLTCGALQKQLEQHSARNKHLEEQLTRSKQQVAQEQVGSDHFLCTVAQHAGHLSRYCSALKQ